MELDNALAVARHLIRHPSAIPKVARGIRSLQIPYEIILEEHSRRRTVLKHACGFAIYLNPDDLTICPSIAVQGWHELRLTELFVKLIKQGNTIVDIGANIGWFTLLAAKHVGNEGTVISFEPEPTSFQLLSKSVQQNRFSNVKLIRQCVSDDEGVSTLYLSPSQNFGAHSIMKDLGGPKIVVSCTRLDSVASILRIHRIHLLKIDVEGAEPKVLAGAQHLLDESKIDHITMEWNPQAWDGHKELLARLVGIFDVYSVSRSLPFLILRKLSLSSLPNTFMSFLYLRRRK